VETARLKKTKKQLCDECRIGNQVANVMSMNRLVNFFASSFAETTKALTTFVPRDVMQA